MPTASFSFSFGIRLYYLLSCVRLDERAPASAGEGTLSFLLRARRVEKQPTSTVLLESTSSWYLSSHGRSAGFSLRRTGTIGRLCPVVCAKAWWFCWRKYPSHTSPIIVSCLFSIISPADVVPASGVNILNDRPRSTLLGRRRRRGTQHGLVVLYESYSMLWIVSLPYAA